MYEASQSFVLFDLEVMEFKQLLCFERINAPSTAPKIKFLIYANGHIFFNCLMIEKQYLAKYFRMLDNLWELKMQSKRTSIGK